MVTKKKKTTKTTETFLDGYIPAGYSPTITQSEINQVPPYADSGVRFEGYYKIQTDNNKWIAKKQDPVYTNGSVYGAGEARTYVNFTNKTFYMTHLFLSYNLTSTSANTRFSIGQSSDSVGTTLGVSKYILNTPQTSGNFVIDYSSAPIKFETNSFFPYLRFGLAGDIPNANDRITFSVIGFTEI